MIVRIPKQSLAAFSLSLALAACDDAPARGADQYPISASELAASTPADSPAEADYRRACLPCHGIDGRGNGGTTGADFTSATGPLTRADEELVVSVRDGTRGSIGVMPPHGALMSEEAIRAVVAYVRAEFGGGVAVAAPPDAAPDGTAAAETP